MDLSRLDHLKTLIATSRWRVYKRNVIKIWRRENAAEALIDGATVARLFDGGNVTKYSACGYGTPAAVIDVVWNGLLAVQTTGLLTTNRPCGKDAEGSPKHYEHFYDKLILTGLKNIFRGCAWTWQACKSGAVGPGENLLAQHNACQFSTGVFLGFGKINKR